MHICAGRIETKRWDLYCWSVTNIWPACVAFLTVSPILLVILYASKASKPETCYWLIVPGDTTFRPSTSFQVDEYTVLDNRVENSSRGGTKNRQISFSFVENQQTLCWPQFTVYFTPLILHTIKIGKSSNSGKSIPKRMKCTLRINGDWNGAKLCLPKVSSAFTGTVLEFYSWLAVSRGSYNFRLETQNNR